MSTDRRPPLFPPATVGFVGLGDQGLPMAVAVAESGFGLHVWARRAGSLDGLTTAGAAHTAHQSLRELAATCDLVAVCVSTDDDTAAVAAELLPGMRPGSVLVDHGTGTPANAAALAARGAEHGIAVLDAPVSGGRPAAEARRLTVLVGGDQAVLDQARPVLDSFATDVVRLGGHGVGQTAKLINNTLLMLNQAAVADILALAADLGVDARALQTALAHGSGSSTALSLFGSMITSETVDHLHAVQDLDMDLFDTAVRDSGADPDTISTRARSGAARMRDVVTRLGA